MSRSLPIYTVDAFTSTPYAGNPAAVCIAVAEKLDEIDMLKVSKEMNLSETAFVAAHPEHSDSNPIFGLRWFTPTVEVALCGHATLATAHVLFNEAKLVKGDLVLFETQSGVLKVRRNETELELDFPRGYPLHFEMDHLILEQITACFGLTADSVLDKAFCTQTKKMILELDKPSKVWAATVPDAKVITSIPYPLDVRGIAITCGSQSDGWKSEMMQTEVEKSSIEAQSLDSPSLERNRNGITPEQAIKLRGCDFMTRYFSPWNGIPEDPVNGSSHTLLPYYYSSKLNKNCMKSHAASSRGGYLRLTIDAEQKDRIFIAGNAATVLQGTLRM